MRRLVFTILIAMMALAPAHGQREEEQEEITQTLELPKDLPTAVVADARRLVFRVTPLSGKGLLSQQVRDALRWLLGQSRGETIVKLRAFVAGSGDLRRVQVLVSEIFGGKRLPLPALSVVQAGALPVATAQVVFESVAVHTKREQNPNGVAFLSVQGAAEEEPLLPVAPLATRAVERLKGALARAGAGSGDALRVTCFLSTVSDWAAVREAVGAEFPKAALNLVQVQRAPMGSGAECEAVARLSRAPAAPLEFVAQPAAGQANGFSQAALVNAQRIALTGTQLAFGYRPEDARLAFERLGRSLEQVGASFSGAAAVTAYPLSRPIAELVRKTQTEFFADGRPPAGALLTFEGLPSVDASFAVDLIAVMPDRKQ